MLIQLSSPTVMTMVTTSYKIPCNDQNLWTKRLKKQGEGGFIHEYHSIQVHCRCLPPFWSESGRGWHVISPATDILTKTRTRGVVTEAAVPWKACGAQNHLRPPISNNASRREIFHMVWCSSESSTIKKQLRSLESYFGKLQNKENRPYADSSKKMAQLLDTSGQSKLKRGLGSLEDYLGKLNKGEGVISHMNRALNEETTKGMPEGALSASKDSQTGYEEKLKSYVVFDDAASGTDSSQVPQQYDEASDFHLIGILASINIAVFLFEIASPIRNSELQLFTIPLIYGAKINDLILIGEWWRLVTPMFLHSGLVHVALGCWSLLTFAPQVSKTYGSFTFFLIYILGGISGNLTSFLHTPEPTVGGTLDRFWLQKLSKARFAEGPVFAIIGAWLIYQYQNKDVIAKGVSDSMFQKAVLTTALSFILSTFGPIDDWTHFGAALTGIIYGFFTCPTLQVDDASSSKTTGREEGITLVRRNVNPVRSLLVFAILIGVLSSLLFFIEPPLSMLASESLL